MLRLTCLLSVAVVLGLSGSAPAQVMTFDFTDGTDQGWGNGFGNDASRTFPIDFIGGSNRMRVLRMGGFQEAGRESINTTEPFYLAMQAAAGNEAGYLLSYDWYIDTAPFAGGAGSFFQIGTFVNSGSGYYAQNFPEVELNQAQLTSGSVFSGTFVQTFADKGYNMPAADTFFRLGFALNGDGAAQTVHFDNITITPVPEPSSLALLALGLPALLARRRRRAVSVSG